MSGCLAAAIRTASMAYVFGFPKDVTDIISSCRDFRFEEVKAAGGTPSALALQPFRLVRDDRRGIIHVEYRWPIPNSSILWVAVRVMCVSWVWKPALFEYLRRYGHGP